MEKKMDDNRLDIKDDGTTAPVKACVFAEKSDVLFAEGGTEDDNDNGFRITGYSGGIIKDHWYWGNLAIDLEGAKFAKGRIPVLQEHFTSSPIGFSTKQEITDRVTVEGRFLPNDNAQSLRADMKAGLPMEASLYCPPAVIEYVKEGSSVKVNGRTLKGPGAVFRRSVIKEVSMCVFGYDSDTRSSAMAGKREVKFSLYQENNIMAKEKEEKLTIESFAREYPDLHGEITEKAKAEGLAEGKKAEQDRFESLREACGGDNDLLAECFAGGLTTADALKKRAERLAEANKKLSEENKELKKNNTDRVDPAATEFSDEAADPDKQTAFDEKTATEEQLKEHYQKTAALQDEFHSEGAYLAYVKKEVRKAG